MPILGRHSTPNRGENVFPSQVNIPDMGNGLRNLRLARGWTHERAAAEMGISKSGYTKLERAERKLTDAYISQAMRVYGVTAADVLGNGEKLVKLAGFIGAGQEVYQFDEDGAGYVEAPPNAAKHTEAVEVRGDSMLPLYEDGTVLYYSKQLAPETVIGKRVIVRLEDERVLVKTLRRGSARGLWTLVSLNAPDIEDVAVQWAAPIDWIKP